MCTGTLRFNTPTLLFNSEWNNFPSVYRNGSLTFLPQIVSTCPLQHTLVEVFFFSSVLSLCWTLKIRGWKQCWLLSDRKSPTEMKHIHTWWPCLETLRKRANISVWKWAKRGTPNCPGQRKQHCRLSVPPLIILSFNRKVFEHPLCLRFIVLGRG